MEPWPRCSCWRCSAGHQKPLSELTKIFEPVPQTLAQRGGEVERRELGELPLVMAAIKAAEQKLGRKNGRVLVRFSGTEPKARILIEGPDESRNEQHAKDIAGALNKWLG